MDDVTTTTPAQPREKQPGEEEPQLREKGQPRQEQSGEDQPGPRVFESTEVQPQDQDPKRKKTSILDEEWPRSSSTGGISDLVNFFTIMIAYGKTGFASCKKQE